MSENRALGLIASRLSSGDSVPGAEIALKTDRARLQDVPGTGSARICRPNRASFGALPPVADKAAGIGPCDVVAIQR